VGLTSGPLLAALRKACRGKLTSMQPAELLTLLTSLAALGQQDLLYLDEISRYALNHSCRTLHEMGLSRTSQLESQMCRRLCLWIPRSILQCSAKSWS
jgi:hypothetical protein